MDIAYLDKFNELQAQNTFKGEQWFGKRKELVEEYSWAVPNEDVIKYCAEFDELLEIGAGSGYWAHLIEEAGGSVKATDISPESETYSTVTPIGWENMFDRIGEAAILMVWPPYDEGVAHGVVKQSPDHILYVGEQRGGCTASDEFFYVVEQEYGLVGKIDIPSYAGIHDNFYHYARNI